MFNHIPSVVSREKRVSNVTMLSPPGVFQHIHEKSRRAWYSKSRASYLELNVDEYKPQCDVGVLLPTQDVGPRKGTETYATMKKSC